MPQLQPVIWAKGTFLTPQHLQLQDRFFESLLAFRLRALNFRPWGFSSLEIDREALTGGSLMLQSASGIFPDGLLFDIPASDAAPAPKPLLPSFSDQREGVYVHLAIPAYRDRGVNVVRSQNTVDARYSAEPMLARDENAGGAERPLQVARKNFRFVVDGEGRADIPSLRVARIRKSPAGQLELDPHFVPPLLNVAASDFLMSTLRRLLEILTAKSGELGGSRRQKNQSLADFTTADIANFWLLYTVNSWLPEIRHIFETRRGHPEEAFRVLSGLAGALTTFSKRFKPRDLPVYNHDELGPCFIELDEKLRLLLETVVPSNFISLPLKLSQPSIYAAALDDEKYLQNTKLYLAISAGVSEPELITKVPQLVKLSSTTQVEYLIRQALPGIPLRHVASPPPQIPVKLAYQYFSLGQTGEAWAAVTRARNIAAWVPGDFPDPRLELLILLPEV